MSDLIDREDLIDRLTSGIINLKGIYGDLGGAVSGVREMVKVMPSAEPEMKNGKWLDEKINSYTSRTYCSECGNSAPFICVSGDHYGRNMHGETNKTKFCPNCGAKMDWSE